MAITPLISVPELEHWVQEEPGALTDDPWAEIICKAATVAVNDYAFGSDDTRWWLPDDVPLRVLHIVAQIAKRNWINPNRLSHEGGIGPLQADTYVLAMAAGFELTEYEQQEISRIAANEGISRGGLSILQFSTGRGTTNEEIYVNDEDGSALILLSGENDPYYVPTAD